jgi:replicative DNA helicase
LRESGSIEQDADIVSFLWNEPTDGAETTSSDDVIVKFIIAKHRGGQTKSFKLNFKKSLSSFTTEIGG